MDVSSSTEMKYWDRSAWGGCSFSSSTVILTWVVCNLGTPVMGESLAYTLKVYKACSPDSGFYLL